MTTRILLPKLGYSMTEGVLAEWLVADGGNVQQGQLLYALESEKSLQEIESPASGTLRILQPAGASYPVNTLLGEIG